MARTENDTSEIAGSSGASGAGAATVSDTTAAPSTNRGRAQIVWDDSRMATHFSDVVNIHSTQEQVNLFFGTNQTWNPNVATELKVDLQSRVILTPHAAKRLWSALGGVVEEYEERFGELKI
jgi:hypothetical protein